MEIDILKTKISLFHTYNEIPIPGKFICCQVTNEIMGGLSDKDSQFFHEFDTIHIAKENFGYAVVFGQVLKQKNGQFVFIENTPYFQAITNVVENTLFRKWTKMQQLAKNNLNNKDLYWFYFSDILKIINQ